MNNINLTRRGIGINLNENKQAQVVIWAPLADTLSLKVNDSSNLPLSKDDFGYWKAETGDLKPGDKYKVVLNNELERPDPTSLYQPESVHGPSEVIDLKQFNWEDKGWNNIPLKDYILYELHTGTFTPEGTFEAIESKLDYLIQLGITAIEIMPVSQFPGNRNWGYDGVFPFAVHNTYGGPKGLQRLVNACHQKGLAVVLDVVYNHMGPEGNYLNDFGPYFTDKYSTPWGKAINFDDSWCDGVRQYFIENVLMWFRDFHIDALRMDAVHAIKDFSPKHILREIKEYVNQLMEETGRTHYLIIECDLNDTKFINPLEEQGYGMDAQWIDEFHHALRVTVGEERTGYYADFDGLNHLAKAYRDAYVYDGQYSPHRHRSFGVRAEDNPGEQLVVFSQNHDQIGNRMLGERTSKLVSFEMQKLMAGAVMVSPYLPMLFMGEEYSEPHPFLYFISHTDPQLVEAVRKGRKAEFKEFHDKGEAPDPQSTDTFEESMLQWDLLNAEPHKTMFRYYQELIALRKTHPALNDLNRKSLDVRLEEKQEVLLLHRWHEDQHALCFMNFSKEQQKILVPPRDLQWEKTLDSADPEWNGPAAADENVTDNKEITLQPESILIYTNSHV
jgi:maltooligosyltrehalose trehalohydrolase